jgi:2-polyprenyl-3-methyl-5-hydroxy-6-metoxy-1,4-benzoquinol methylase
VDKTGSYSTDLDFYWGEIAEENMESVVKSAFKHGWVYSIREILDKYNFLGNFLLRGIKNQWVAHCLKSKPFFRVLDIGSGWGQNSFALADISNEVWSVEGVKLRTEFQLARKLEENVANINILHSNFNNFPLTGQAFDLIIVSGVLEWVGLDNGEIHPAELQRRFLNKLSGLLMPGGILFIGIENRTGIQYFFGGKDHLGTRFTTLMPRCLASLATNIHRKYLKARLTDNMNTGYRTYTYTYWKYQRILQDCGLNMVDIYWALQSYNEPRLSGLINDPTSLELAWPYILSFLSGKQNPIIEFILKNAGVPLKRWIKYIPPSAVELFAPNFLIFAAKPGSEESYGERIFLPYKKGYFRKGRGRPNQSVFISDKDEISAVCWGNELERNKIKRESQASFNYNPANKFDVRDHGSIITVVKSKIIYGEKFATNNLRHRSLLINWLADFHRKTFTGYWNGNEHEKYLESLAAKVSKIILPGEIKLMDDFRLKFIRWTQKYNIKLSKVCVHGDFAPVNIIIRNDRCYVFDWEYFDETGDNLSDVAWFVYTQFHLEIKKSESAEMTAILDDSVRKYKWLLSPIFSNRLLSKNTLAFLIAYAQVREFVSRYSTKGAWEAKLLTFSEIMNKILSYCEI